MSAVRQKLAVVLFNLGGPDGPDAVRPFLYNLFRDKAIIGAPALIRYPLAAFISTTRAPSARKNYDLNGRWFSPPPGNEVAGGVAGDRAVTQVPGS